MTTLVRILRDTYRDSVELMRVAAELESLPGVQRAALLMATPANRDLLATAGLLDDAAAAAGPGDLVIAVAAASPADGGAVLERAVQRLTTVAPTTGAGGGPGAPRTIAAALQTLPDANLAIISTPGAYATAEALKALKRGLHAFVFSDNVSLDDEIMLKRLARERGLLCLGPDSGTAILEGIPLGFANAVRRGRIGLVGASGTGLQAVSCLVDRLGEGISHAIGTGGRDLHARVGGLMTVSGLERLAADPATAVVVLVSKPPAPEVARHVLASARAVGKPVVACFLGGDPAVARAAGAEPAATLEAAAAMAVALVRGPSGGAAEGGEDLDALARAEARRLQAGQRVIRGLYSGGTLAAEAGVILREVLGEAATDGHTLVDLGDDEFTVGRPHPMIDGRLRAERLVAAADDPAAAVVLLDVVLGYGSHPDPAAALAPALGEAQARAARAGRHLAVLASVCGTAADPQSAPRQEARLSAAGVRVLPSNARAARLAGLLAREAARG